jgi:hypothetical protein
MKDEELVHHLAGRIVEIKWILQTFVNCKVLLENKVQWRLLDDTSGIHKDGCLLASWKNASFLTVTLLRENLDFVKRVLSILRF